MRKKKEENLKKLKEKEPSPFTLPEETKRWIFAGLMFLAAIIISLSFFDLAGIAGQTIKKTLSYLLGKTIFVIPLILVLAGLVFIISSKRFFFPLILAIFILILGISGILGTLNQDLKGGWLGYLSTWPSLKLFGILVTQIIFGGMIILGGLIFWQLLRQPAKVKALAEEISAEKPSLIKKIFAPKFKVKEIEKIAISEIKEMKPELKTKPIEVETSTFIYQPPPIDLLEAERGGPQSGDIRINSAIIKKTLENFDIKVEMSEVNIGPTVTQYTLKPAEGVKLSKITALSNDLALALASHPIRIEAPIPGRALVGVEVPNKLRAQVRLRDLISNPKFQESQSNLTFVLGRDVSGFPVFSDLARMPHLLVAGATGTGKTIFLNSLILSLLYRPPTLNNPFGGGPEILRFILVDPKRVEFPIYNELPHLLTPVIYDSQKTVNALKWLISEMERRFEILSESKDRDIISYNQKMKEKGEVIPYIILIIDELADLMAAKGREVEAGIVRLAQMARAVGIHLVVATQRPSVEVITGLIKANITSRITFQVASQVDSRTVLDMAGAEKLLGLGDMLFVSAEIAKPKRIQAAYVSEKEVKKVVNHLKSISKIGKIGTRPIFLENQLTKNLEQTLEAPTSEFKPFYEEEDPLYEEAKKVVLKAKKASASLLQRKLRIGYARAARLIDMLEERGIIGPGEGAKPREVYFDKNF